MDIETRFDELYRECKRHAKTARLIEPVAHGNWLVAIESLPGTFLMIKGDATPNEVACALATRHVEQEARAMFLQRASIAHMETAGGIQ